MSLHHRILLSSEINGRDLYQYSSSPPLPTNHLADSSTAVPFQRHLSNAAIASVSAVSAAIFLALTYYSVLRHRRRRLLDHSDESYYSAGDETSDDDGVGAHHVWNIRTVGLDNSAILSLGSYAYLPPPAPTAAASPPPPTAPSASAGSRTGTWSACSPRAATSSTSPASTRGSAPTSAAPSAGPTSRRRNLRLQGERTARLGFCPTPKLLPLLPLLLLLRRRKRMIREVR
ncbi:putative pentatricopeptide repeat-containing protein, mitochondrial [Iris pallida]|uniref:Pentatricopeptide repeat-containing protein, mitochondrial n=1 Tax=Iris pallida TaxID=29817 RepID=A0AAX6FHW4_IRIPA|nr:putative pentatricopeptide repeat-containing protein, mitochondrial [Iris pallida]